MSGLNRQMRIGDVFFMQFTGVGNEQSGWRPGLVFQNNVGNDHSPNIIALPLTSSIKKLSQPTHVFIPASDTWLYKDSVVLCENPERMSKSRVGEFITTIPDRYMKRIAEGSILATSAISFIDIDSLISLWKKAVKLNSNVK